MATGFTWETQNKAGDTAACQAVWQHGKRMLADSSLDLVLLDEVTYMLTYDYLELEELKAALLGRPAHQTVILTGRGCHRDLLELADTVTEMRPVKHAFDAGVKAQQGSIGNKVLAPNGARMRVSCVCLACPVYPACYLAHCGGRCRPPESGA